MQESGQLIAVISSNENHFYKWLYSKGFKKNHLDGVHLIVPIWKTEHFITGFKFTDYVYFHDFWRCEAYAKDGHMFSEESKNDRLSDGKMMLIRTLLEKLEENR